MKDNITLETIPREKTVVDFWAEWCAPCRQMAPHFEGFSEEFTQIEFAKINVDLTPEPAKKFNVTSIPTFIFFENGKEVYRIIGVKQPSELRDEIYKFANSKT